MDWASSLVQLKHEVLQVKTQIIPIIYLIRFIYFNKRFKLDYKNYD